MKSLSLVGKLVAQPIWAALADLGSPPLVLAFSVLLSTATLEVLRLGTRTGFYGAGDATAVLHWSYVSLNCTS